MNPKINDQLAKYGLMVTDGDKAQAAWRGLMNASSQLMAAGATTTDPGHFAKTMAGVGPAFTSTYDAGINQARNRGFNKFKMSEMTKGAEDADIARNTAATAAERKLENEDFLGPKYPDMPAGMRAAAYAGDEQNRRAIKLEQAKYRKPGTPAAYLVYDKASQQWTPQTLTPEQASQIPQGYLKVAPQEFAPKTDIANWREAMAGIPEDRREPFATWLPRMKALEGGFALAQPSSGPPAAAPPSTSSEAPVTAVPQLNPYMPKPKPQATMTPISGGPADLKTRAVEAAEAAQALRKEKAGRLQETLSPGEIAIDKAFAEDYAKFVGAGDYADSQKQFAELDEAEARLRSGKENITGTFLGLMPDLVTGFTHPQSLDVRDLVSGVVQRNLRLILGAQFTQEEGKMLIARAYNERLDEGVNAKRVSRLLTSMKMAYAAKLAAVQYFGEHGTLKGYDGPPQMSMADIEQAAFPMSGTAGKDAARAKKYGLKVKGTN